MPPPYYRELIESEEYQDQLEKLGGARALDNPLRGVLWSLAVNPEVWPLVPGYKRIRLAYTEPEITPRGVIAGLRVWFEILDSHQVLLQYLDVVDE